VPDRPYVLLSAAMSADGYLDDAAGRRLVLSDEADLDRVDQLRAASDAIMVGAQTIRSDNPGLRIRSAQRRASRQRHGRPGSPLRVTVTRTGDLDPAARFFAVGPDEAADPGPLVYLPAATAAPAAAALGPVATLVPVPADPVDLAAVLADLAARGVGRLMVEGGARTLAQLLGRGLADEFLLAVAPVFVGDPAAPRLLASLPGDTGPGPGSIGRMSLAAVAQAGDMAVLRFLPRAQADTESGPGGEPGRADRAGWNHD